MFMKHLALKSEDFRRNGSVVKYPAFKMNNAGNKYGTEF